jgi:ankyrin repeat protein
VIAPENDELHAAAQRGDLKMIERLVAAGHDINAFDGLGMTPLHYAAKGEQLDVAAYLLRRGADVNAHHEASIGNTPLAEVAGNCSLPMATLLVEAGADPTIPGWMQLTALHRAARRKRGDGPRVYQLLLDAEARVRSRRRE